MLLATLGGVKSLAMVGIGKNVGKTTALNHLIREAKTADVRLGLTSIGRDGELFDAITFHAKPPIQVPVGGLVATVEGALPAKKRAFRVLEKTDERTALGPVVIAEALQEVQWEVSGPSTHNGLQRIKQRLLELGAALVVIDGAFDRRSSATPTLTDATILVSGAALDSDMGRVIAETAHLLELFSLPVAELDANAQALLANRGLALTNVDGTLQELPLRSALGGLDVIMASLTRDTRSLLVGTALTQGLLEALEPLAGQLKLVVRDGTQALIGAPALRRFSARGGRIEVARLIRVPVLVCNPYSPYGWRFDSELFLEALARAVAPLPVVDLLLARRIQNIDC
jgi:hypothetical protein